MATILNTTQTYNAADVVTHTNLNNIVGGASFVAGDGGSTDNTSLEVDTTSGSLQIKDDGVTTAKILDSNITAAKLATDALELAYPVGSIYMNSSSADNPSILLGFGTWVAFGAGRVLIGEGTATDAQPTPETKTFTNGDTGGEFNHTLTTAELPAHTHTHTAATKGPNAKGVGSGQSPPTAVARQDETTSSTGGGDEHNNQQPFIVVRMWTRTA